MYKKEYNEQKEALKEELRRIRKCLIDLDEFYAKECMERNGYKVGDTIMIGGRNGIIVGATITNGNPQLDVHKICKDGTISEIRNFPLCIYLNQE